MKSLFLVHLENTLFSVSPNVTNVYTKSGNKIEEKIANIWKTKNSNYIVFFILTHKIILYSLAAQHIQYVYNIHVFCNIIKSLRRCKSYVPLSINFVVSTTSLTLCSTTLLCSTVNISTFILHKIQIHNANELNIVNKHPKR